MIGPIEVHVDVTADAALGIPVEVAASVYVPDLDTTPEPTIAAFAFPGGGYNRQYYDLTWPECADYSQATYHRDRGSVFVACDHLGVGDSSIPDLSALSFEALAAANHAAVEAVTELMSSGTLVDGLPPIRPRIRLGMGQSMGGCLLIVQQALHHTFDGVAVLGFSAIHTVLPVRRGSSPLPMPDVRRGTPAASMVFPGADRISDDDWSYAHHWTEEPSPMQDIDNENRRRHMDRLAAAGTQDAAAPWGSATVPLCALTMMSPSCIASEAAAISVPVLLATGERDVVPDPRAEPAAYARSDDISVFVLPRSAHMHNFAPTRKRLWRRVDAWGSMIADHVAPSAGQRFIQSTQ